MECVQKILRWRRRWFCAGGGRLRRERRNRWLLRVGPWVGQQNERREDGGREHGVRSNVFLDCIWGGLCRCTVRSDLIVSGGLRRSEAVVLPNWVVPLERALVLRYREYRAGDRGHRCQDNVCSGLSTGGRECSRFA